MNCGAVCVVTVLLLGAASFASAQGISNYGRCDSHDRQPAMCIEFEKCDYYYKMAQRKPLPREDRLFLRRAQCGTFNGNVLICCPDRYIDEQPPKVTVRKGILRGTLPEPGKCGNAVKSRIHGGNETKVDEFPWMALIEYDKGDNIVGHQCGGSLINDRYILTAAHCVKAIPDTWKPSRVRLGEWDTSTEHDCYVDAQGNEDCAEPHIDVPIEQIIPHENYDKDSQNQLYDIALLRLEHSVNFTEFIQPICLPVKEHLKEVCSDGIVMNVAGWGITEFGSASKRKMRANVAGVPLSDCQRVYRRRNRNLDESQICAGGQKGIDACGGDSGGPLVALDNSDKDRVYLFQAGLVSYGPTPCGLEGWPGVYTKVSHYMEWIQQNIEP